MPDLSLDLKRAIRSSGHTRYRVAKLAGITQTQLDRFLSGQRDIRLSTAAKLASGLDLELRRK